MACPHTAMEADALPAITQEQIGINTLKLASRIKDVLQHHNLSQKLFGEAVLGLTQAYVSDLLSKPKPWHMLTIKGRQPFIKMHFWLCEPNNVERLKCYQNEKKAQQRNRRRTDMINWFHNHLNRSGQQWHIGSETFGSNLVDGNSCKSNPKSESRDGNLMQSDNSSLPYDTIPISTSFKRSYQSISPTVNKRKRTIPKHVSKGRELDKKKNI